MKLKRILAGALAAVVSISTVALASLSTASAADPIEADWLNGSGKLEGAQFKVIQNWNPGTEVLEGAEEFYISFDIANDNDGLQAYLIFQDIGNKHSNWNYSAAADAACPAVDCSKAGTYTVGYKGAAITTGFNFLAVAFVDAAGKEYGNDPLATAGITLKGVYAEAPTTEPDTTEPQPTDPQPTDPQPTDPQPTTPSDIAINACLGIAKSDFTPSVFKDPAFGTVIKGDGQYTLTVDVSTIPDNAGNTGYEIDSLGVFVIDFLDTVVNYPNMTATLDKIEIDGEEFEFDASKVVFGNLEKDNDHSRLEIYNTYGETKADSPIDADAFYAADTISVTFTVSGLAGEPDTTEPEPTTEPTTEPCDVTVSITPDKTYALPGSEVTYTVAVTPNQNLGTLQMRMDLPEGLSYVPESFVVDANAKAALGWTDPTEMVAWTESTLFLNGFASVADTIEPGTTITLGSFKVVAAEEGTYAPAFTEYEFTNMDFATLSYGVAATAIVYTNEIPTDPTDETDPTDVTNPTDAPVTDPTDAPATDPTNAPKPTSGNDDPTAAPTTAAPTTAAPTTAGSNNGGNTPNTGAQAAVGLSIFMAAGLAGVVAIKKRRK